MTDLFKDKAVDWDERPVPTRISEGVGAALLKAVILSPDMHVMDFGAGTGLLASHVAPHVERIYAVDISAAMLEKLAAKPSLQGKVKTVCRDILKTPLGTSVDLIVSAMAMHHVADLGQLVQAFADHLPTGGVIAVADLDSEDGSFHPSNVEGVFHDGIDRETLRDHLKASGFGDIDFVTAVTIDKNEKRYPIFLVTAVKS
ncbi:MAG: putative TPR repeat methyltransferase [Myxococcota bacterium]|jgi:predicted TPR repeat methyltransferase